MNLRFATTFLALLFILTGCAATSPAAAPATSESADERNRTIASCGVVGKLLMGEIPVNSTTYADVEKTLRTLASSGPGEVKTTAQFILDDVDGKRDHTSAESDAQVEKFKNYCMNYTID